MREQLQPRKHGHIASIPDGIAADVRRVQTLLADLEAQVLDDGSHHLVEQHAVGQLAARLRLTHRRPEVVQCLLAHVRFVRLCAQRILPDRVEHVLLDRLLVGEVEHLLEQQYAQHLGHRLVRPAVVRTEHRGKHRLVPQQHRQRLLPEHPANPAGFDRPVLVLQIRPLLRREQHGERPERGLRIRPAKHQRPP